MDETYVKVAGQWRYVYRAIDQFGQVIDVFVSVRDAKGRLPAVRLGRRYDQGYARRSRQRPSSDHPVVLEELLPAAWHRTEPVRQHRVEAVHGRLKAWLRPIRGLKQDASARVIIAGHAFVQNLRRGHYERAVAAPVTRRVAAAFDELALAIRHRSCAGASVGRVLAQRNRPLRYSEGPPAPRRLAP